MKNFTELIKKVRENNVRKVVAVAAAEDIEVLQALKDAQDLDLAQAILFGHEEKIRVLAQRVQLKLSGITIAHEPDQHEAARKAVACVRRGDAHLVMKGLIGTASFLKAILEKDCGLRSENILSHVALFESPYYPKLLLVTDCAMNIAPSLQEKEAIIKNAIQVCMRLGIKVPKVAAVCAVETVTPNMPATVDAALLAKMGERGQIKDVIIDGPLGLDNALSSHAAQHKGIKSPVAGDADIILVPNIESGNMMYKTLVYLAQTPNAGVVMGALAPIVLTSRADTAQAKLNSIALGLLIA